MLVLNLPFKALMFLTLMRPSLVLFLVLWLKLVKDFLKVRCRLALLPFLISCLIWLDLVARSEERFSRNAETDIVCRLLLEKKNMRCDCPVCKRSDAPCAIAGARARHNKRVSCIRIACFTHT